MTGEEREGKSDRGRVTGEEREGSRGKGRKEIYDRSETGR